MIYPDFYPFYATQGSPGFYNEEREQETEFDLMRSYYPDTARRIQEKAEAQCHQVKEQMEGDTSVQEIPGGFLDDLIEVLVYQEISRRRCRRRRCRKCFRTEY